MAGCHGTERGYIIDFVVGSALNMSMRCRLPRTDLAHPRDTARKTVNQCLGMVVPAEHLLRAESSTRAAKLAWKNIIIPDGLRHNDE